MKIWTMVCAAGLSICGFLNAQSAVDTLRVHFSSPVMVGEALIPAGDCTIHILRGSGELILLSVRSDAGDTAAVPVYRDAGEASSESGSSVVLERHGKDLRLQSVWLPDHTGFSVH